MTDPVTFTGRLGVQSDKVRMVDYGGQLKPTLGGPVQNIMRLGTRHAIDITFTKMRSEPDGRILAAKLRMAKIYGAIWPFTQDGFTIGNPGAPVVNGSGQSGIGLSLRGIVNGYTIRLGQAFTLMHGGRGYLHFAAADVTADNSGVLNLPIFPMLRVLTSDGDVCNFAAPTLQGSLTGNEAAWSRLSAPFCDFGSISISEDY